MEPDQVDVVAFAVLRDLEEVQNPEESEFARELRCNVRKSDGLDRIHLDFALSHAVSPAPLTWGRIQIRMLQVISPATNSPAEPLCENHK